MSIMRKLKGKSGFSLAETLLAVLILLLVSVIVANGIPMAKNVYNNVLIGSNAQLLLSTGVTALRNELSTTLGNTLSTAPRITVYDESGNPVSAGNPVGKSIKYYKAGINAYSLISLAVGEGEKPRIRVADYVSSDPSSLSILPTDEEGVMKSREARDLVTRAASNGDLYITYESITDETGESNMIVFNNLQVFRLSDDESPVASLDKLYIRIIPQSVESSTQP